MNEIKNVNLSNKSNSMKKIIVTGCAGFIGSAFSEFVLKKNMFDLVVGLDNLDSFYDVKTKKRNLTRLKKYTKFKFFNVDIRKVNQLEKIEENFDLCLHFAGMPGVIKSVENPSIYFQTNLTGTLNVLNFLHKINSKKIIFASSSSVYKSENNKPFHEDYSEILPLSPYGYSKMFGESLIDVYCRNFEFDAVKLRLFSVYGPNMRPDLAIFKFTDLISKNKPVSIYGNGLSKRDYTYIDDVVDGILKSVLYLLNQKNICETINLGNAKPVSLKNVLDILSLKLSKEILTIRFPNNACELETTFADISKAKKLLKYNPKTDILTGIDKFIDWYLRISDRT